MKTFIILLLILSSSQILYSQLTAPQINELNMSARGAGKAFEQNNFTSFGNSAFSNFVSNISVSSTFNKGENGKAELKYTTNNWWTSGITLEQKLGKTDKEAALLDLFDGVSSGTSLNFNLQKLFWNPLLNTTEFNKFNLAANSYAARLGVPRGTVTYNQILQNGTFAERNSLYSIKLKNPVFFNLKAGFTKTNFDYTTDSFSLKKIERNYLTPNVSFFLGFPLSIKSYSENYQAADELSFTVPFGTSNNSVSENLSFGVPKKQIDNKLYAEWRMSIGNVGSTSSFSIGPSITWGLTSKKVGLFFPIYFIDGKDNNGNVSGLQGGFRLRYIASTESATTFKEGFGAQLFVTAPFNIFANL
jgi:hypothetical protein